MIPGTWDMLIYTREFDAKTGATEASISSPAKPFPSKDTTIALTAADVPHTITLGGRARNRRAADRQRLRQQRPHPPRRQRIHLAVVSVQQRARDARLRLTPAKTLLFYETMLDAAGEQLLHDSAPASGRRECGCEPDHRRLRAARRHRAARRFRRRRAATGGCGDATSLTGGGVSLTSIVDAPLINARVFVSPDVHPNYTYGISFGAITDGVTQYTTPLLRVVE